jgi:glycerophosphoryl diester phosphodiesterase
MGEERFFDIQGHRGARGLKPENTLPSFEAALDAGVTTVETDLHLTRDAVPVLMHDHFVSELLYQLIGPQGEAPIPARHPLVSQLSLRQLRCFRGDLNPDPACFPTQDTGVTPLAHWFSASRGFDPYAIPTLADLFAFAAAYAGEPGRHAGKTDRQRQLARQVRFDLELKRVPFHSERIGDAFQPEGAGLLETAGLETAVLEAARSAGVIERTIIRSFDHRSIRGVRALEPDVTTAVLVANTAPAEPAELVRAAGAQIYGPDYHFLDQLQVRQLHSAGIPIVPWTVNDPEDWARLCDWGVDGITTDYPDRLAEWWRRRRT